MDDFIVTYACYNVHTYTNLLGDQIYCLVIIENIEFIYLKHLLMLFALNLIFD